MISCFAHGFIAEKPAIEMVGANSSKCVFTVLWSRPIKRGSEWDTVWERAVFVAWNEEAERVASRLDKGSQVTCTGTQETSSWNDQAGQKRYTTRYRLTSWTVEPQRQQQSAGDRHSADAKGAGRQPYGGRPVVNRDTGERQQPAPSRRDRYQGDDDSDQRGSPPVRQSGESDFSSEDDFIRM